MHFVMVGMALDSKLISFPCLTALSAGKVLVELVSIILSIKSGIPCCPWGELQLFLYSTDLRLNLVWNKIKTSFTHNEKRKVILKWYNYSMPRNSLQTASLISKQNHMMWKIVYCAEDGPEYMFISNRHRPELKPNKLFSGKSFTRIQTHTRVLFSQ